MTGPSSGLTAGWGVASGRGWSQPSSAGAGAAQGIAEPLRQFEPIMDMLGSAGIWARHSDVSPEVAGELERLGYSTLWLGASPPAGLDVVNPLLGATETLVIGTSIVNIWTAPATSVAVSFHRLEEKYPGRFVLGIGAGHRENEADFRKPYEALVDYLDELDRAGVAVHHRALAALGPRVLDLARTRSAGALPYLQAHLHRGDRGGRPGAAGRVRGEVGGQVPGHREVVGVGLGRVRAVPLLRSRCSSGHLHHERHRERERSDQKGGQSPRSFPQRDGGAQVRVPGRLESRSDGKGLPALVESMEGCSECLYNRLPGPYNNLTEVTEIHSQEKNQLHRLCDSPSGWSSDRSRSVSS